MPVTLRLNNYYSLIKSRTLKRNLTFLFAVILIVTRAYSQNEKGGYVPEGKAFAVIYTNFHKGIAGEALNDDAFELQRAYLGYEYNFSPDFYAKINIDIGSPEDLSPYAKIRRYAYFKNAFLRYNKNRFEAEFGLINMRQFKLQEEIWERRYLMKTLADENKLGTSADLGFNVNYKIGSFLNADFTMMNGEGYNSLQMDDVFKYSLGATIGKTDGFISRLSYDFTINEMTESTFLFFMSYFHKQRWNLASEFIYRKNEGWRADNNIVGYSIYGKFNLAPKYQLFARFDKIGSNILEGEINPWHLSKDGTALVAGVQFSPVGKIKMALNYHDWYPWAANRKELSYIYLNIEVKM